MVSRAHPTPHHKYRIPIRSRSRGGGERLFDTAGGDGSSTPSPMGKLWLLPVMVAVGVAVAYFGMTGGPTRNSLCETLRALNIDGPKSCRNVVWVRAKSREWTRDRGITVWLVEHDMRSVMSVCEHIFVIDAGRKIAEGAPQEIVNDPRVVEAYLGPPAEEDAEEMPR